VYRELSISGTIGWAFRWLRPPTRGRGSLLKVTPAPSNRAVCNSRRETAGAAGMEGRPGVFLFSPGFLCRLGECRAAASSLPPGDNLLIENLILNWEYCND
jgi:hypothetical protein